MERLKGKTILIGKQAGEGHLSISFDYKGNNKILLAGEKGSVPDSVSRYKPTEKTAHCSLEFGEDGNTMTLINLNPQNKTFVNGTQIMKKAITKDSEITLGCDNYKLDLEVVFNALHTFLERVDPTPFDISSLEHVWKEYDLELKRIKEKQINNGKRRLIPIIIGSLSGVAAPVLATALSIGTLGITIPITLVCLFLYLKIYKEKDTSIEDTDNAKDKFIDNYVCPSCHHFMGFQDYKIVRQNTKCPYCQAKFKAE